MGIKKTLRQMRASQPWNHLATSILHKAFTLAGHQSEFVIKHLPRTGITSIALPDAKILKLDATGEDWIPTQLFWRGWQGYDPEVTAFYYRLAESAQTVFDVGAHIGFFSILAGLANPAARVFAFEPLDQIFSRLTHNVALNGLTNVHCFRMAAGATEGVEEFYFPDGKEPVSSSLRSDMLVESLGAEKVRHVPVPVVTLDEIVARHGVDCVSLIKLDTERTEHDVLAGCRATLERDRPEIICEVWPDAGNQRQLEDVLRPLDYHFYQLRPEGPAKRTEIIGSAEYLNYLFTARPSEIGL